jgi:hypothetical protein
MTKIRPSEAALPLPINITGTQFDALEKQLKCKLSPSLRTMFENACSEYRDSIELHKIAARPREVVAAFSRLRPELSKLQKSLDATNELISRMLASEEQAVREAAYLLTVKPSFDPEFEPLPEFSHRARTMTDFISARSSQFKSALGGQRGPDRDAALGDLFRRLAKLAKAAGIQVTANYSASRRRVGRFVRLVHQAYEICHGAPYKGSGLDEKIARFVRQKNKL